MFLSPDCKANPSSINTQTDIQSVKTGPKMKETKVKQDIPIGRKEKPPPAKKVWTKLKSGLFGWSTVGRAEKPSPGIKSRTPGKLAKTVHHDLMNNMSKTRQIIPPSTSVLNSEGHEVR